MITLDENLFDDNMTMDDTILIFPEGHFANYANEYDDELFDYEPIAGASAPADHNGEAIPEGPKDGLASGVADSLIDLINDEWEAIKGYNDFRAMIIEMSKAGDRDYTHMLAVIDEVINEENLHVGQLQELLKEVSPNANSIENGQEEAREQLQASGNEWVNGKLKVEAHAPIIAQQTNPDMPNAVDMSCMLADVDDEW